MIEEKNFEEIVPQDFKDAADQLFYECIMGAAMGQKPLGIVELPDGRKAKIWVKISTNE